MGVIHQILDLVMTVFLVQDLFGRVQQFLDENVLQNRTKTTTRTLRILFILLLLSHRRIIQNFLSCC
jgi:hypothetical protein